MISALFIAQSFPKWFVHYWMTFCKNSIRISCQIIFVNKHWPQSCLCPFNRKLDKIEEMKHIYSKNGSSVATFLHVLHCTVEGFISYYQVDVCQLQRRMLELFISYHPTALTVAERHKAFHTSSNCCFFVIFFPFSL